MKLGWSLYSEKLCSTTFSFLFLREAEKEYLSVSPDVPAIGSSVWDWISKNLLHSSLFCLYHKVFVHLWKTKAFKLSHWQPVLAQTTTFTWNEKCVQWLRMTQLRAVPFKAIKCGFFFSEVILFNPSGLKQPIKQSL